ncbi:MAG: hypothetical protein ACKV0T_31965 [Planctomycetales bacterium]
MAGELLLATVRHVWAALKALHVDAALMGGIAVAAWQHVRNTRDVDVLVGVRPPDDPQFLDQLKKAGFKFLRDPPILFLGDSRILQLSYEPPGKFLDVRVDLFFADTELHRSALERRIEITLPGMDEPTSILSCEDLILMKLLAGRLLDKSDAAYLLRFNKDELDLEYLRRWAAQLSLDGELTLAWNEAFSDSPPGDPCG